MTKMNNVAAFMASNQLNLLTPANAAEPTNGIPAEFRSTMNTSVVVKIRICRTAPSHKKTKGTHVWCGQKRKNKDPRSRDLPGGKFSGIDADLVAAANTARPLDAIVWIAEKYGVEMGIIQFYLDSIILVADKIAALGVEVDLFIIATLVRECTEELPEKTNPRTFWDNLDFVSVDKTSTKTTKQWMLFCAEWRGEDLCQTSETREHINLGWQLIENIRSNGEDGAAKDSAKFWAPGTRLVAGEMSPNTKKR
jgi:hypothetical protein